MLRPGGKLGVGDFHLPTNYSALGRTFWKRWLGHDGVNLSADHVTALQAKLDTSVLIERTAPVPYYLYVGRKR